MQESHIEIQNEARQRRRYRIMMLGMLAVLCGAILLSFWIGYYPLTPGQVVAAFLSKF